VLNDCAAANMKALGGMAPDLVAMQKAAGGFWNEAQRVKRSGFGRLCQAP
jgi:hypothetical protein